MSEWLEAITKVRIERAEKPPKGFKTAKEIAKEMDCTPRTAREILAELTAAGRAEMRSFKVQRNDGQLAPIPHYKLV